jgi:hypothetical protein
MTLSSIIQDARVLPRMPSATQQHWLGANCARADDCTFFDSRVGESSRARAINVRAEDRLGQDEMLRLFFTAVVCALTLLPAGAQTSGRRPG